MAARPRLGVERVSSVYGGTLALRGVKIRVTRMFTTTEFAVPMRVNQCKFDPSDFHYNFTVERDVVRRAKEREIARVAAVADAADDSANSLIPRAASQIYESVRGGDVLQPTVCMADTTSSLSTLAVQTAGLTSFLEFENQSSNPFEDLELQTIDDMGELRTILQPVGEVSGVNADVQPESQSHVQPTSDVNSRGLPIVDLAGAKPVPKPRLNVTSNINTTYEGEETKGPSPVPRPRTKPSQNHDNSSTVAKLPAGAKPTVLQAAMQQAHQSESELPPYPGPPLTSTAGSFPTVTPSLESFPLSRDMPPPYLPDEDRPPPIPPRLRNQGNDGRWHAPPVSVKNHHTHSWWKKEDLGLIDPSSTLKPAERGVVDELYAMGFARDQVARAVKRFGMDQKMVVDFLIDVQKIADMPFNYPQDSVELSLTNNKGDVDKTLDSLKTVSELKELGFPENTIHEALHATGNDRDKAIEFIINHT